MMDYWWSNNRLISHRREVDLYSASYSKIQNGHIKEPVGALPVLVILWWHQTADRSEGSWPQEWQIVVYCHYRGSRDNASTFHLFVKFYPRVSFSLRWFPTHRNPLGAHPLRFLIPKVDSIAIGLHFERYLIPVRSQGTLSHRWMHSSGD